MDREESYKKIFDQDRKTLIVFGGVGVGKTHLVENSTPWGIDFAISDNQFKEELNSGILQLPPPEIYGESAYKYTLVALAKKRTVLFDDFGASNVTDAYIQKMKYWIDERLRRQAKNKDMKTIITTNLTMKDIEKIDERIKSRLMLDAIILEVKWKDMRQDNTRFLSV